MYKIDRKQQNNQLKIVHFGQKHMPSREGGVEIVAEELTTRMAALGHSVTCINRRGHHVSGAEFDGKELQKYKGVKIESVPTIPKKGIAAASSSFFATLKASFGNYDIVHIHAEGPAVFCWLPKLFGKKVICQNHGADWARPRWQGTWGGRYIKYGEKMTAKYADEIIVLSKGMQDYFLSSYGRETIYIPNGVTKPQSLPAQLILNKWNLVKDSYILALARLTDEKKIHLLIKAFMEIDTNLKLVIAGGSSDSEKYINMLHKLADNDPRIIFTGFVQGEILEELYSNAYIYCLPSELEGMPLSLLEAMSYGNCCLTANIPECTDVVEDHAVSFKKNDIDDLKDKIQYLIHNPDKVKEYKETAADYICHKYNWDNIVNKMLLLYKQTKDDT